MFIDIGIVFSHLVTQICSHSEHIHVFENTHLQLFFSLNITIIYAHIHDMYQCQVCHSGMLYTPEIDLALSLPQKSFSISAARSIAVQFKRTARPDWVNPGDGITSKL